MNLPKELGRYRATPREWSLGESGKNKIPTWTCLFDLVEFQRNGQWETVSEQLEITGYFYIFKTDGQPNQFTIDSLKESIKWDGRSLAALNDNDWSEAGVQLTIGSEVYEGKTKIKVQFINPWDYAGGGVEKADAQTIVSLEQKYGATLRALSGPAGNGAAKAPAPKGAPQGEQARTEAWEAFKNTHPDLDTVARANAWKSDLASLFPGKQQSQLTAADWKKAKESFLNPQPASPLRDEQVFTDDDIPF